MYRSCNGLLAVLYLIQSQYVVIWRDWFIQRYIFYSFIIIISELYVNYLNIIILLLYINL